MYVYYNNLKAKQKMHVKDNLKSKKCRQNKKNPKKRKEKSTQMAEMQERAKLRKEKQKNKNKKLLKLYMGGKKHGEMATWRNNGEGLFYQSRMAGAWECWTGVARCLLCMTTSITAVWLINLLIEGL